MKTDALTCINACIRLRTVRPHRAHMVHTDVCRIHADASATRRRSRTGRRRRMNTCATYKQHAPHKQPAQHGNHAQHAQRKNNADAQSRTQMRTNAQMCTGTRRRTLTRKLMHAYRVRAQEPTFMGYTACRIPNASRFPWYRASSERTHHAAPSRDRPMRTHRKQ
jgi:hypothetical protein